MTPEELKAARKRLGYTMNGMAGALGFGKWGYQTISKMESGKAPISDRTAKQVEALTPASTAVSH